MAEFMTTFIVDCREDSMVDKGLRTVLPSKKQEKEFLHGNFN